ncbi:MAG: exodeoxyribonuclease V subunit gamma [Mycobacteriaceae bacterium]|nr:exodeoxyribonuclease V subunit gamma [Mycobacteriaceae bacterium]
MALHLHRAERTDLLADQLGALLATPLPDPFTEELVLVAARGVERWLSQRLSHLLGRRPGHRGDGICAGVLFTNPQSLITEITGTVDHDPWSAEAMTWPLMKVIDASLDQPWCRTLATHLGHYHTGPQARVRRGRRYAVARRLAGLFASYARQRPQLLADWLAGVPTELDTDLAWQPKLWQALVATISADPPHLRHRKTVAALRAAPTNLPARLSLFGHTRLAYTDVELLDALATHHDVHLWLAHPSNQLWQALAGSHGVVPRTADTSRHAVQHPLLQTLGRDLRELQRLLPKHPATDEFLGAACTTENLLGWLQSDIAANATRPQHRTMAATDRSVQIHSCYGSARQIDALRDVLLGLLADDPTLEPRDIVVMCPDIETYAPLIVAGFGLGEAAIDGHPAHRLRVQLADRALTATNPVLDVATELLAIADSRATASQVLNLAEAIPVREKFGFDDEDLTTLAGWVREAGIRWGFDPPSRAPYGLERIIQNTWRFGLDRILTGVAMSDDSQAWLGTALPLDNVSSNQIELAGKFAEYLSRLQHVIEKFSSTMPLESWLHALRDGIDLLTRVRPDAAWQSAELDRILSAVRDQARSHATTALQLADVRALLADQLTGQPTRANFRTGTLTVCTMVPMRSVPHRVVCLVGLDDGVFPRLDLVDGDDALARQPVTGERDVRSEDRQLLLDAVCAATSVLVITYTGADEHSGQVRPPAVPLAELLDALDHTTTESVRDRILVRHPLQPFDIRNTIPGELIPAQPFTFDPTALISAQAAVAQGKPRKSRKLFNGKLLPRKSTDELAVAELQTFFKDPVKGFFRSLDYPLATDIDTSEDEIPVDIDSLQEWSVGNRLLNHMLHGMDRRIAIETEWRRGTLPPGQLGWRIVQEIGAQAAELAAVAATYRRAAARAEDVDVDLGNQRRLSGTVTAVFDHQLVSVTYATLAGKHLLQTWISLLALKASYPEKDWSAVCIGRTQRSERIAQRVLAAPANATTVLSELVQLYDNGHREPLPLPIRTSYAWAQARLAGKNPLTAAGYRWHTQHNYRGENAEPAHVEVWDRNAGLDVLLSPPQPGEEIDGENTRLGALAARLWFPLLRAEQREP